MNPEEVARLDLRDGDWAPKAREWRATDCPLHCQVRWTMRWTTKPVARDMENDNTIIANFKMKMAMILRGNEEIKDLRFKSAAMFKNFEPKNRKRFRGISKAIFKYGRKQLAKGGAGP